MKIYFMKLQILAIFGYPRNIIPLKIPCLMVCYTACTHIPTYITIW